MKIKLKIFLALFAFVYVGYSCTDQITYAEELKAEKELIADYVSRMHIVTVSKMPTTFPWPDNVYYKSSTGLYFRLESVGDSIFGGDTLRLEDGDVVVARYIQYTLTTTPDTIFNQSTVDYAQPSSFIYNDATEACDGWQEAVQYMKYMNSKAKIIVPSKLGFSTYSDAVTPIGYDLSILLQKK